MTWDHHLLDYNIGAPLILISYLSMIFPSTEKIRHKSIKMNNNQLKKSPREYGCG
jgi:hypothetical protein